MLPLFLGIALAFAPVVTTIIAFAMFMVDLNSCGDSCESYMYVYHFIFISCNTVLAFSTIIYSCVDNKRWNVVNTVLTIAMMMFLGVALSTILSSSCILNIAKVFGVLVKCSTTSALLTFVITSYVVSFTVNMRILYFKIKKDRRDYQLVDM